MSNVYNQAAKKTMLNNYMFFMNDMKIRKEN